MNSKFNCFDFYDIEINEYPYITKPLTTEQLRVAAVSGFNLNGFNLTPLERLYHLNSGIEINQNPMQSAAVQEWIYSNEDIAPLYIDYSWIYTRYAYAGDAREQIRRYSKNKPEIKNLLNLRPRYGMRLKICYMDEIQYFDIIKVNSDSRTTNEIYKEKKHWELYIKNNNLIPKIKTKIN